MSVRNIGASVRDRLLNKARAGKLDYNLLLTRYALERLLYRLSVSEQRVGDRGCGGYASRWRATSAMLTMVGVKNPAKVVKPAETS